MGFPEGRHGPGVETYFLKPGYIYVVTRPTEIITVLGSCVSVCLHDRVKKYGGMNHFQLPRNGHAPHSSKFGDDSIRELHRIFMEHGSHPGDLEAKIIGGAYPQNDPVVKEIALGNIAVAREMLKKMHIPVLSDTCGGDRGRKVYYLTATNELSHVVTPYKPGEFIINGQSYEVY